jgi:hypothetical protein
VYNQSRWAKTNATSTGIDYEFQHRYNHFFKRNLKSAILSSEVFASVLDMLLFIRLSGKGIKALIVDLGPITAQFGEDIIKYAFHDLTSLEQVIISSSSSSSSLRGKIDFKLIGWILEKNKDTLTRLCFDTQI